MRTLANLTGFLFGLVFAVVAFLAMAPAHSDEPKAKLTQMMIIVAYSKGEAVAAQAVGFATDVDSCRTGLLAALGEIKPKKDVTLAAVCTPLPPAPMGTIT